MNTIASLRTHLKEERAAYASNINALGLQTGPDFSLVCTQGLHWGQLCCG